MLRSRIIPCLLIHQKGLVKTVKFKNHKYVGDPINAVRIFNEKEVDELMVFDIDATVNNLSPNFDIIEKLANECRMPFCYGGGVKSVEHAKKIINLGAEKVAISSAVLENFSLCKKITKSIGVQSLVIVLDIKKNFFGKYEIFTNNGKKKINLKLKDVLIDLNSIGVGELVINSIDNDGNMKGYDIDLAKYVREIFNYPLTILGGAGSIQDIKKLIDKFNVIGAAAGSLFVFKGKYKAVLINYPSRKDKFDLY